MREDIITNDSFLMALFYWIISQTQFCEAVNRHRLSTAYKHLALSTSVLSRQAEPAVGALPRVAAPPRAEGTIKCSIQGGLPGPPCIIVTFRV